MFVHPLSCSPQTQEGSGEAPGSLSLHPGPSLLLCRDLCPASALWFLYQGTLGAPPEPSRELFLMCASRHTNPTSMALLSYCPMFPYWTFNLLEDQGPCLTHLCPLGHQLGAEQMVNAKIILVGLTARKLMIPYAARFRAGKDKW